MAPMLAEVRDAGASEEKSRAAAATAVAHYENRFDKLEAALLVVKWMVGAILAGAVSPVVKAFFSRRSRDGRG